MTSQQSVLSATLEQTAHSLQPYIEHDFSFDEFLKVAYTQVVDGTHCHFFGKEQRFLNLILNHYNDSQTIKIKDIITLMEQMDFYWQLYDECVDVIQTHGLDVGFGEAKPTLPYDIDALSWLTVADIKAVLKQKGEKLSGKREELEERFWGCADIDDIQDLLAHKLEEKIAKYQVKTLTQKYELLIRFIKSRAYFLQKIANQYQVEHGGVMSGFKVEILNFNDNEQDFDCLLYSIYGITHNDIVVNNQVGYLLPLLPNDLFDVNYQWLRKNRATKPNPQHHTPSLSHFDTSAFKSTKNNTPIETDFICPHCNTQFEGVVVLDEGMNCPECQKYFVMTEELIYQPSEPMFSKLTIYVVGAFVGLIFIAWVMSLFN